MLFGNYSMKLILASKSEGRKVLFNLLGVNYKVHVSHFDESTIKENDPYKLTQKLAEAKTNEVAKHYNDAIVVGGDTVLVFNGKIYGKQKDPNTARKTLKSFIGKSHKYVSGFCVINTKTGEKITGVGESELTFRDDISDKEIERWIKTGLPAKRAGGYQPLDASSQLFVSKSNGSFSAFIGLPIEQIIPIIRRFGIEC